MQNGILDKNVKAIVIASGSSFLLVASAPAPDHAVIGQEEIGQPI